MFGTLTVLARATDGFVQLLGSGISSRAGQFSKLENADSAHSIIDSLGYWSRGRCLSQALKSRGR